jgi:hypothetical protein
MMQAASALLRNVVSKAAPSDALTLQHLEQALFMIGYDVNRQLVC